MTAAVFLFAAAAAGFFCFAAADMWVSSTYIFDTPLTKGLWRLIVQAGRTQK